MSVQVRRRRETAAFLSTFVGAQGELLVDTTNNRVQVHDGATPGGFPAARLADLPSSAAPLSIASGGTGATTGGAALAALGAIGRTAVADANYAVLASDRTLAFTALTAARVATLPAAASFPTGTQLLVMDESGQCSATNTITLTRSGTDTISGAASAVVAMPYGYVALTSNGAGRWTIVDQATASLAQQPASSVAITGGAIDGTAVGPAAQASGAFTTLTASGQIKGALVGGGPGATFLASVANNAAYGWQVTGQPANGRLWDTLAVGTSLAFRAVNDANSNATTWLNVVRSGFSVTSVTFGAPVALGDPLGLKSYTVATLPAPATAGRTVHCSNARMQTATAGTLESAGAGTGGLVTDNGTAWKIAGTNITASA